MSECLVMAGGFVVSSAIVLALMDTVGGAKTALNERRIAYGKKYVYFSYLRDTPTYRSTRRLHNRRSEPGFLLSGMAWVVPPHH